MNRSPRLPTAATAWRVAVLLAALAAATPSQALYKVIGPDGKVTYTDRPPTSAQGKVSPLGGRSEAAAAEVPLPAELRPVVARYPVSLYTTTGNCEPCDAARALLRQRGIPFAERQVISNEDGEALQRLSGGRDAPTLSIGAQTLRGLSADVWHGYLDSAGYPRESRLPPSYQNPAPTPLAERRETPPARAAAPVAPAPAAPTAPTATTEPAIRF